MSDLTNRTVEIELKNDTDDTRIIDTCDDCQCELDYSNRNQNNCYSAYCQSCN